MDDDTAGLENTVKASHEDIAEQYETQPRERREAHSETMPELKFRKNGSAISNRPTIDRADHDRDGGRW